VARAWIGIVAVGILLCSCSGSSVAQDRESYVAAQRAVAQDQQIVFGMDAAGSAAISCFSATKTSSKTTSPECSFAAVKAEALAKLGADESRLSAAAHQLESDNASPQRYP